ncbi:MAG: hypothetical protein Q9184_007023 [Pyrenodesmia sp. 2 TL-2023]
MTAEEVPTPNLPFPIFQILPKIRYLLFDIQTVTWLRRTHNILGVLIGSLPQSPQQNVFLGLPLELQPEEARLLVEKRIAYIVDDLQCHQKALRSPPAQLNEYKANVRTEGLAAAKAVEKQKIQKTADVLGRMNVRQSTPIAESAADEDESIFKVHLTRSSTRNYTDLVPYSMTPATSYPPIIPPSPQFSAPLPEVNNSAYALFKHLHSKGYFMSPGLRFGCQFSVYPGDPLRFHSHFLATSAEWDEEIDLLDIVGGGRLGTGVKKGWLIGGVEKKGRSKEGQRSVRTLTESDDETKRANVRTFCMEWGGM